MRALTPVGNKIKLGSERLSPDNCEFAKESAVFFTGSGTQALSLAVKLACKNRIGTEVLLPAYTCPDVVSAVIFAGATPVLVDLVDNGPWLDLSDLHDKIGSKTSAIIAVNFLGIRERISEIRTIIGNREIVLIDDSCQAFPGDVFASSAKGDLSILSFGRGKPITLLEGGALVVDSPELAAHIGDEAILDSHMSNSWIRVLSRAMLYNFLTSPRIYDYASSLPGLGIGDTKYKQLDSIQEMGIAALTLLRSNYEIRRRSWKRANRKIAEAILLFDNPRLVNLPRASECDLRVQLLRYPMLLSDKALREATLKDLSRKGLGGSSMYRRSLPDVYGVPSIVGDQGPFPRASSFAERLLTLPIHDRVSLQDADAALRVLVENLAIS